MDTFRKVYAPLSDQQKMSIDGIKDSAQAMLDSWNTLVPLEERSDRSRCMAIARTNLEQAIMWAVKGIASAEK